MRAAPVRRGADPLQAETQRADVPFVDSDLFQTAMAITGVVAIIGLVFVMPISAAVSASRLPTEAWAAAGMRRELWIALMFCGVIAFIPMLSLVGIGMSGVYWLQRRRVLLNAVAESAEPPPGPAAPPTGSTRSSSTV